MAHIVSWLESDTACIGKEGEYVLVAYSPSEQAEKGVDALQVNLGELATKSAIEERWGEVQGMLPERVAAYALMRRCFNRKHRLQEHEAGRESTRFRNELVESGVLVKEEAAPISIFWSSAAKEAVQDPDWIAQARVRGGRPSRLLAPTLFLPRAELDVTTRSGAVIEARSSTHSAQLFVALDSLTKVVRPKGE